MQCERMSHMCIYVTFTSVANLANKSSDRLSLFLVLLVYVIGAAAWGAVIPIRVPTSSLTRTYTFMDIQLLCISLCVEIAVAAFRRAREGP